MHFCMFLCFLCCRFAQFFHSPLFNQDTQEREVNAVDSENEKNIKNDAWRCFQLEKSTCKEGHPYAKFNTGRLCWLWLSLPDKQLFYSIFATINPEKKPCFIKRVCICAFATKSWVSLKYRCVSTFSHSPIFGSICRDDHQNLKLL